MAVGNRNRLDFNLSHFIRHIFTNFLLLTCLCHEVICAGQIDGFRVEQLSEENSLSQMKNGRVHIFAGQHVTIRVFGMNFQPGSEISFSKEAGMRGTNCQDLRMTEISPVSLDSRSTGVARINLQLLEDPQDFYYFCLRHKNSDFIHQGSDAWLQVATTATPAQHYLMPVWLLIIIIIVLLVFSGMFSGLNLGLMSLDKTELEIMINSGTPKEKEYAKVIKPIRRHGNFLLCTILLSNVLINNTMAILLEQVTGNGIVAVVGATLGIVIIGEIIPQALCTRYGLQVAARTVWFTKFFMFVTFPLSYPISRALDCVLGEEIGHVYNRDRLRELIHLTGNQTDLRKEEVNIITGALELSRKTVNDIMTNLEDVFMLEINSVLDFETMNLIMKHGYTRVPVYENTIKNIIGLLNIKDLAFVDPDDRMPLKSVVKFYNHPLVFVQRDTPLDIMLQDFKNGHSHLAVVQRVSMETSGDKVIEPVGLVTLEDIIEEIIQAEILDETDIVSDNRRRLPRNAFQKDFSIFNQPEPDGHSLSPQLNLATCQFLSTSVPPFSPELISENILQKLLRQDVVVNFHLANQPLSESFIYTVGKPYDFFTMILQGRVEVEYPKDGIHFEGGPFTYFGIQTLKDKTQGYDKHPSSPGEKSVRQSVSISFVPEYNVRALTDLQYLRVSSTQYYVAAKATQLERQPRDVSIHNLEDTYHVAWELFVQESQAAEQTEISIETSGLNLQDFPNDSTHSSLALSKKRPSEHSDMVALTVSSEQHLLTPEVESKRQTSDVLQLD